jgi:hypothetical protein
VEVAAVTDSLLTKTSKAMYRADLAPKTEDWSHLPPQEKRRYEVMAAAALSVALREPAYPDLSLADVETAAEPVQTG